MDALDPADPETFERCILDHRLRHEAGHREVWLLYRSLLALRSAEPALRRAGRAWTTAHCEGAVVTLVRTHEETIVAVLFNLCASDATGFLPEHDVRKMWEEPLAAAQQAEPRVDLAPWQFRLFRARGGQS